MEMVEEIGSDSDGVDCTTSQFRQCCDNELLKVDVDIIILEQPSICISNLSLIAVEDES